VTPAQRKKRASYEWKLLKEHLCSDGATRREVTQAIREYAYQSLLAERSIPLRKVA
jgi:hypothetical protein